jgi:hypothetical protein
MEGNVQGILTQIATLERTIINPVSGSACRAYDNIPYTLTAAQMPCFVNFPRQMTSMNLMGSDEKGREFSELRNFELRFYLVPYGTGAEEEKSGLLIPWIELTYVTFGAYPHLKGLNGIMDSKMLSDTGVTVVEWAGNRYFGLSFTLSVLRRVRRLLNEDE